MMVEISIKDLEEFRDLILLIQKYYDQLPKELQEKLKMIEEKSDAQVEK